MARKRTHVLACIPALAAAGCLPHERSVPFPPTPLSQAARLVNENIERIDHTLRAVGSVDGYATLEDGRRRSFHLDGTLFYLAPSCVRLDLRKLGDTQILLGSNPDRYWFYSKEDGTYQCGRHDIGDDLPAEMPLEPLELIDALGLTPIPIGSPASGVVGCVQRIVDDHQQVLFLVRDDEGEVKLEKEYWLDRYSPQLIGRVLFRDADGTVEMESRLGEYERLASDGPWLPRLMVADWRDPRTHLSFRIRRWTVVPHVGPQGVQFATPRECEGR